MGKASGGNGGSGKAGGGKAWRKNASKKNVATRPSNGQWAQFIRSGQSVWEKRHAENEERDRGRRYVSNDEGPAGGGLAVGDAPRRRSNARSVTQAELISYFP